MKSLTLKGILLGIILLVLAAASTAVVYKLQNKDANKGSLTVETK